MNKALAEFLFTGEVLFKLKDKDTAIAESLPVVSLQPVLKENLVLIKEVNESNRVLLNKILASVNLTPQNTIVITETKTEEYDFSVLTKTRNIINFGTGVPHKDLSCQEYYRIEKINGKNVLLAHPIEKIEANQENEKKKLWEALKSMFS